MKKLTPFLFFLVFIAVWVWLTLDGSIPPYLLPSPEKVLDSALVLLTDGTLITHLSASLQRVGLGFLLSVIIGFTLALTLYFFPLLELFLSGFLSFLRMTPPLALIPLFILWLGIGSSTQLAVIILASIFPVYLNARTGFSALTKDYKELADIFEIHGLRRLFYFILPAALPHLFTGIRLCFGYCWRALVAAELIASASGLGHLIIDAEQMQRADVVIVGVFVIGFIGKFFDQLFILAFHSLFGKRFPEI